MRTSRGRRRELLSMAVDHDVLVEHLTRLQLTCIRDQLDSLLDEAGEKQLTLREAVAFLVGRRRRARTSGGWRWR